MIYTLNKWNYVKTSLLQIPNKLINNIYYNNNNNNNNC